MLVAGAKRHAREILEVLHQKNDIEGLYFFDDVSNDLGNKLYGQFPILKSLSEAKEVFKIDSRFALGVGNSYMRKKLAEKLCAQGGTLISVISNTANIGHYEIVLESGLNIMHHAMVSNGVSIGEGTLINASANIHHDVKIGRYCEVSPHAVLLGCCMLGDFCAIGSNSTILPDIKIGNHVTVGAGAMVNKDLPDYAVAVGIPAKIIKVKNHDYES